MIHRHFTRAAIVSAIAGSLLATGLGQVLAQDSPDRFRERREQREQKAQSATKSETRYPQASRKDPGLKTSARRGKQIDRLFDAYNDSDAAKVQDIADPIIADEGANAYERAVSARLVAATNANTDNAKAKDYLRKAIEFNGLSNNEHYDSMRMLAQLQLQDDQFDEGLATLDRYISETKSTDTDDLALKGQALYLAERQPEAIAVLKPLVDASPEPKKEWVQMLMNAYIMSDQPGEASRLAESLIARNPDDAALQLNLAGMYMQADQNDKAIAVLEQLRSKGQLSQERDYRNLYAMYMNSEGQEQKAIDVINAGLQQGVLKESAENYNALAQAYWFSEQQEKAVETYQKAAPLASDGETYLNLARALNNLGRNAEAKKAAQQALAKGGLKNPQDAKRILGAQ